MDPFARILAGQGPRREKRDITTLARLILSCHKKDLFCVYVITGPRGAGKSTYALMSLDHAYKVLLRDSNGTCHFDVEKHVIFDAVKFFELVYASYEAKRARCEQSNDFLKCMGEGKELGVIFDDAGILVGSSLWFEERQVYFHISKILDVIRPLVSNLILTVPSISRLASFVREAEDVFIINVYPIYQDRKHSIAEIWSTPRYSIVKEKVYRKKLVEEIFPLKTPCYESYLPLRLQLIERVMRNIEPALEGSKEKKKKALGDEV